MFWAHPSHLLKLSSNLLQARFLAEAAPGNHMKLSKSTLQVAGALLFTSAASAQVMTEVRISTAGVDQEYVEIFGTAGQSTDGLMVAAIEGDPSGSTGGAGFMDELYDLSGNFFGAGDQYFVFGSPETDAAFPGMVDLVEGANMFENSSMTIYLLMVPDATLRADMLTVGTGWIEADITSPAGSTTTLLASTPGITILDAVAFNDGDAGDVFFDSVPVFGPDGSFMPSGVLRDGGCPNDWCNDTWINFSTDGVPNPPYADPTPGTVNPVTSCMTVASPGVCDGGGTIGTAYCMAALNSTGVVGEISATGSLTVADNDVTLIASNLPVTAFGFFITSLDQGFVSMPGGSSGNLCVVGAIGRYVGPGQIQNSGTMGTFSLAIDLSALPQPTGAVAAVAGDTWNFQTWFRDSSPAGPTSNFTRGLEMTFN